MVIAILVLLGGLAAHAAGLLASVGAGQGREIAYARATLAAEAGLDWGRFRIRAGPAALCAATQTLNNLPATLAPYAVTVRCTARGPFTDGSATLRVYQIVATGCNRPAAGACPALATGADGVQRTLQVLVER